MRVMVDIGAAARAAAACAAVAPKRDDHGTGINLVHLDATGDGLRLAATDTETTVALVAGGTVDVRGQVAVPAAQLSAVLRAAQGEVVELRTGQGKRLEVRAGRGVTRLPYREPEDLVPMPLDVGAALTIEAPRAELLDLLGAAGALPVAAAERYGIAAVELECAEVDGERIVAVLGTDGHRLARYAVRMGWRGEKPRNVQLPATACARAAKMLAASDAETATLRVGAVALRVDCGAETLRSRCVDGQFPQWQGIVAGLQDPKWRMTVRASDLRGAAKRLAILTDEEHRTTAFDGDSRIGGGELLLTTSTPDGEHVEAIAVETDGHPPDGDGFGMNMRYISEAVDHAGSDTVVLTGSHALAPVGLSPDGRLPTTGVGVWSVLMPLRLH